MSVGSGGVSIATSSSRETVSTPKKYWENSNGAKSADDRSNIVISPARDYNADTIAIINTATVKLKGDPKPYSISAGA